MRTSRTANGPFAAGVQVKDESVLPAHAPDRVIVKFKERAEVNLGLQKIKDLRLIRASVFKVPAGETAAAVVDWLSSNPVIEYVELDYQQKADVIPNDSRFNELWGLHNIGQSGGKADADIDAPEAWNYVTGSSDIVVGVIDTGVDYTHTDLADNIWTNIGEIPSNGIDDDANGYIDDVHGINAITGSGDPMDDNSYGQVYHGTHCSGTIGAVGDNAKGVAGVCWTVKIMGLKFLDSRGSGYTADAIECIQYAVDKGADVLSNSWGGGSDSQALEDAIEAAKNAGILFIAAAGNDGRNNDMFPHYPSSYDNENIIAVAATDRKDLLASFSNYGPTSVDVAAPGVTILSCKVGNAYQNLSGTSMAAPHVAGLAALLKSYNPGWAWDEIKSRIMDGVDPRAKLSGKILTGGRINAQNSLTLGPVSLEVTSPSASSVWYRNAAYQITWTKSGAQNANVKILLYKGTRKVLNISRKTPNDESYDWTIPKGLALASNYRIRIITLDKKAEDTSDTFTIAKPSIAITAPVGGAIWSRNTTHDITWTVNGPMGTDVKIHLLRGTTVVQTIVTTTPNNGIYPWTVPASLVAGSKYRIRIKTVDNAVRAKSGKFTIN